jgi:hypothetical protein
MIRDPLESTEAGVVIDSAPNHSSRARRRIYRTRLVRCLAVTASVVVLFYAVVGYVGSANMFGDHPGWRGMNRGPADFGLRGETVSFDSTDRLERADSLFGTQRAALGRKVDKPLDPAGAYR